MLTTSSLPILRAGLVKVGSSYEVRSKWKTPLRLSVILAVSKHVAFQYSVSGQSDPRSAWTKKEAPKKGFPDLMFGPDQLSVAESSKGSWNVCVINYDTRAFMEQCVQRHKDLCGSKYKASLRYADTPFLDESRPEFDTNPDEIRVNKILG